MRFSAQNEANYRRKSVLYQVEDRSLAIPGHDVRLRVRLHWTNSMPRRNDCKTVLEFDQDNVLRSAHQNATSLPLPVDPAHGVWQPEPDVIEGLKTSMPFVLQATRYAGTRLARDLGPGHDAGSNLYLSHLIEPQGEPQKISGLWSRPRAYHATVSKSHPIP